MKEQHRWCVKFFNFIVKILTFIIPQDFARGSARE